MNIIKQQYTKERGYILASTSQSEFVVLRHHKTGSATYVFKGTDLNEAEKYFNNLLKAN